MHGVHLIGKDYKGALPRRFNSDESDKGRHLKGIPKVKEAVSLKLPLFDLSAHFLFPLSPPGC